ncbi:MAG TPA: hypothetical protein VF013_08425 [Candidatus Limnocylindria bacterium]
METYHALTQVAPSHAPTATDDEQRAIAVKALAPQPEPDEAGDQPAAIVNQALEELAREGARRMRERAPATEVDEFLGRQRFVDGVYVPRSAAVSAA